MRAKPGVPASVLVVGPSWVGDMVMAQSLFIRLREIYPQVSIDVLAPGWTLPLIERMPQIRRGIDLPVGHGALQWGVRRQIARDLKVQGYDQALLLPNSFKSALIPFWARIPKRTGFTGELRFGLLNDRRRLDKQVWSMTVERFLHLADAPDSAAIGHIPKPSLAVSEEGRSQAMADLELSDQSASVLALCPGAEYGSAKRWPTAQFAALASRYLKRGWQVWLFGSGKDADVCGAIADAAPGCVDLAGKTRLGQAIDLLSAATAVVSNDSGLMHVAAALNRPLVALYGSSDPGFTPPLSDNHKVLRLGLGCSPCFKRECPLGDEDDADSAYLRCLRDIKVDSVADALDALGG